MYIHIIDASVKDMEAAAVAWAAELSSTPFIALKVVTGIIYIYVYIYIYVCICMYIHIYMCIYIIALKVMTCISIMYVHCTFIIFFVF
jgi:hypothetical protein